MLDSISEDVAMNEEPPKKIIKPSQEEYAKYRNAYALILNHEHFDKAKRRTGTECDVNALESVFGEFRICVDIKNDLTLSEIDDKIKSLAGFDFSEFGCFIIVILTHGSKNNVLWAKDGSYNLYEKIIDPIVNHNLTLVRKPKIFIIQACKGTLTVLNSNSANGNIDSKKCSEPIQQMEQTQQMQYPIPDIADMFLAFSTYEGYASVRYETSGGIFIQKFCEVLIQNGHNKSINEIMEIVTYNLHRGNEAQVPTVTKTMRKRFIFGQIYLNPNEFNQLQ